MRSLSGGPDLSSLTALVSIRHLDLEVLYGHLPPSLMRKLGLLPSLISLNLKMGTYIPPFSDNNVASLASQISAQFKQYANPIWPRHLSRLKVLKLSGHPDAIMICLAHVSGESLECIDIDESDNQPFIYQRSATLKSTTKRSAQTLKTFRIKQTRFARRPLIIARTCEDAFALETLEVTAGTVQLTDSDLLTLAQRLPHLQHLSLPNICEKGCPTLSFLWNPDMLPPQLQTLKISVILKGSGLTSLPILPTLRIARTDAHQALVRLSISSFFGNLPDTGMIQLSKLINYAYPKLDLVEAYGPHADDESWTRVNLVRAALQDVCENLTDRRQPSLHIV